MRNCENLKYKKNFCCAKDIALTLEALNRHGVSRINFRNRILQILQQKRNKTRNSVYVNESLRSLRKEKKIVRMNEKEN